MEQSKEYQKCITNIDKFKEKELHKGLTTKCKKIIDETYTKIYGKEAELELDLYKRKRYLLDDIKANSDLKYDMMMSGIGAFLGAVVGYSFQEIIQVFSELWTNIQEKTISQLSPLEIIYNGNWIGEFVIFFIMVLLVLYRKQDGKKNDELHIFQIDMGNYEIEKIDELLEKL